MEIWKNALNKVPTRTDYLSFEVSYVNKNVSFVCILDDSMDNFYDFWSLTVSSTSNFL